MKWIAGIKPLLVFSPSSGRWQLLDALDLIIDYIFIVCQCHSYITYIKPLNWYWEQCQFLWWGFRQFQQKFRKHPLWTSLSVLCILTSKFNNAELPSLASRPVGPLWQCLYYDMLLFSKARWVCWNCPWRSRWPVVILRLSGGVQVGLGQPSLWTGNNNVPNVHVLAPCTEAAQRHFLPTDFSVVSGWLDPYLAGHSGAQGPWDICGPSCAQRYLQE